METDPRQYEQSYLEAYDAYSDAIFRYCLFQTSRREVALDLAQDTFVKAWEYIAKGGEVLNMRAFLYRIAGNLIIDYRRKKKSDSLEEVMEKGFDVGTPGRESIEDDIDAKDILQIIQEIPEKYRDVIIMRYVDDLSIQEIAEATGEKENNISVRIHRGLEKLRERAEEKYNK